MMRFGRGSLWVGIMCMVFIQSGCKSQEYKRWFLEQSETGSSDCVVGYAIPSFYESSSAESALKNGALNYARNHYTVFEGGQAFWSTSAGRIWMGNNFSETFDSSMVLNAVEFLQPIDSMRTKHIVAFLYAPNSFELDGRMKETVSVKDKKLPKWITTTPSHKDYNYATGVAQESYYEPSAWMEAERMARKNLAGSIHVTIESLNKKNWEEQEIQNQEINVELISLEVAARWKDPETNFYHVLVRMPK